MTTQALVQWQALNDRQRSYLEATYRTDQKNEEYERGRFNRGERSRKADEWRWMLYATVDGHDTPLKERIRSLNLVDPGTGSTFDALETRRLIECRYERTAPGDPILYVRMTRQGRQSARIGLNEPAPAKLPVGTLQEWHWGALARAYAASEQGVMSDESGRYDNIGWNTWRRLRDYKLGALVKEHSRPVNSASGHWKYWLTLTPFGKEFYEREYSRYHELYPDVEAPEPQPGAHP